jgi:hypothetical protein
LSVEVLREQFDRAVTDQIAIADRALSVADAIADTAPEDRHFGGLLYHLQTSQADVIVLAISKLFDPPPRKYPTRSIPGILKLLSDRSEDIELGPRGDIEAFVQIHTGNADVTSFSDSELTRAFATTYTAHLEEDGLTDVNVPPAALTRIRTRRDKQVAHNEDWRPSVDEIVSWQDLRQLLAEAKRFAGLVGPAYLETHFLANDGTYMLTKSSQMVGVQMERVLRAVSEWLERAAKP